MIVDELPKDPNEARLKGYDLLQIHDEGWSRHGESKPPPNGNGSPWRFPLVPFVDLKPGTSSSALVKGLVPRVGLTVVWGPPKCGKSFVVFDMMMHVAAGWLYRRRRVQDGPVVYCAFEGAEGCKKVPQPSG